MNKVAITAIVMQKPDLNDRRAEDHPTVERDYKPRSARELLTAMKVAVAREDVNSAESLVAEAEQDHALDSELTVLLSKCKTLVKRRGWLETALDAMRQDLEEDRFAAAVGHFREALGVSRGITALKEAADRQAAKESEKLLPHNWRVAETILQEAAAAQPYFEVDDELKAKLKQAREGEVLSKAIYQTDRIGLEGRTDEARLRLKDLLAAHPDDSRIKDRLYALDNPVKAMAGEAAVASTVVSGLSMVSRPPDSELDTEGTPNEKTNGVSNPWRTKVLIPNSTWNSVKNFLALAAATLMLGVAGVLVWQHFSRPNAANGIAISQHGVAPVSGQGKPVAEVRPVAVKTLEPPDEEAWDFVKTSVDANILRAFLNTYPNSSHALRVKVKLEELEWTKVDKSKEHDLGQYLHTYPDSAHKDEALKLMTEAKSKKANDGR